MIKNLIYSALAATGVAAATTALVLATASSEPPTSCTVTLDANGGTFTLLETNVYVATDIPYSNKFSTVFNEDTVVTNYNYDLVGWTNATGVVSNDSPVLSDMTCYAKWERSAIQKFNLVNGKFEGSTEEGENYVAQFPAAFYGTATVVETNGHAICFTAPANASDGAYRISFDPQVGWSRIYAVMTIVCGNETNKYTFGESASAPSVPVDLSNGISYNFTPGKSYTVLLDFSGGKSQWSNIKAPYVLGIGLGGHQVKFDSGEYGTIKYYHDKFKSTGANVTTNLPFGYLPSVSAVNSSVSFEAWYSAKKGGVKITEKTLVGTNEIYYAHWKLPTYNYNVTFAKSGYADQIGMVQGRQMLKQEFTSGVQQALRINRYYMPQHKFMGWATESNSTQVVYSDGQYVTDIWDIPGGTCPLYAVWKKTPGENYFTVSQGVTNFMNIAVSNLVTYVNGTASTSVFTLTLTNSAMLRVSLDPKSGSAREGAKLTVYKQAGSSWSNVCSVTDLATTNKMYSFDAATYRFAVTGASASYGYAVGLGATGKQINYDPCGMDYANTSTLSKSLEFNWTTNTPYGYWPTLTSSTYGKHLGWFYNKDITDTNEVSKTESVVSNATVYAHWANQPYTIRFDGSSATSPSPYVQDFRYGQSQALRRNQFYLSENQFMGWATNRSNVVVYEDGATVSNLCTIAGGTNTLYAVWNYTKGTNWYYVAGVMTNFQNISFTQGKPTLFVGTGDMAQFMVTTTNVSKCRVAIDPQEGFLRTGAKLTIDCAEIPTNKTEELEWESACTVTDLADKEVTCSFTTNRYYRFTVSGLASTTNGYVVSIGAEGARYIFDVCGGNFVGEKETTKVRFFNWTVGTAIAYDPPVTTNAYVHGSNTWQYTPQYLLKDVTNKVFSVTNVVISGGEKLYAHWSDALIVPIIFNWNPAVTNVVLTNYYAHGANVYLYQDAYVRQPTSDEFGFLGWTTNETTDAGWNFKLEPVETNHFLMVFYAQWTKEWKTSRTEDGGLSIDGYYATPDDALEIPKQVNMLSGALWPVGVTAIGDEAFSGCTAFSTLNIHSGVTTVGDSAFEDCTALTTVTFEEAEMPDEYATEGFLDGVIDPDSPSVELGECLFKDCTSLKDVDLPLGVNCIPNECFSGCTAMTAFTNMPYTVIEIGDEAFAGCTHLTHVTHPEVVDAIGSGAFKKCARLRFVDFIGDQPEEVASDIFEKTQRNVLVRYLANMCTTAKEYCGGTWSALPATWPSSGDYARTLTWLGGKYPRRKVIFNYNDKETPVASTKVPVLYHAGRVFGLLAPTEDEMNNATGVDASDEDNDEDGDEGEEEEEEEEEAKSGFSGWYTQPMGGRKVGNYWEVPTASEGDTAPITVYAHWGDEKEAGETEVGSRSSEEYPVTWPGAEGSENDFDTFTGFYSADDDMFYYSASAFNGVVFAVDDNMVTGTVAFAFKDGVYTEADGMQSAFTATVTWNNGKTTTISGVADAEGYLVSKSSRWSFGDADDAEENRTLVTKSGVYGWLTDENEGTTFRVYAARNRTAQTANSDAAKAVVLTGLQATKGTWHVVFEATADGEGEAYAVGYSTLVITIADMGQATITGTLGDGTAVSATSTLVIGDGCCCLPVSIRPYGGKGGFSFMLWFAWQSDGSFGEDDASIQGLTDWDASMSSHPFTATLTPKPLTFVDDKLCTDEKDFNASGEVLATITMNGKTWTIPTGEDNPYKLKLSYDYKSGIFSGSFVDPDDATRKAVVNGVFTDRINEDLSDTYTGYGTAVIKGEGSYPVVIGEEE